MTPTPKVVAAPAPELIGAAIVRISKSMEQLNIGTGGLNRKAIIVLIQDQTKLPKKTIEYVLNSLQDLKRQFCR